MKTKIRLLTVIFSILILIGLVAYMLFLTKGDTEINVTSITSIILAVLVLAVIITIIWLTLIISIDEKRQIIIFHYPFRFFKRTYRFSDVIGFRYKYLPAKIDYKCLVFKTIDDKTFAVSDFETSNLRDLEAISLNSLDLRGGSSFEKLDESEKKTEIRLSKEFDIEQAKDIRFFLIVATLTLLICEIVIIKGVFEKNGDILIGSLSTLIVIGLQIGIIQKLLKIKVIIKNGAQHQLTGQHAAPPHS